MEDESILGKIVAKTRYELEIRKIREPAESFILSGKARSLKAAILAAKESKRKAVITEIKPASPSEGKLREVDPKAAAAAMEKGGACAISVLTEPFYFSGSLENLRAAKSAVKIPVIRKDFIVDEYQLLEAKHYGADAVLLMVSVLGKETKAFYEKAKSLGLEAIVEVHDEKELFIATAAGAEIIGINNRNLKDLSIDLNTTKLIAPKVPKGIAIISESGVKSKEDLDFVLKYADAALVGTSLMKSGDIESAVRLLLL